MSSRKSKSKFPSRWCFGGGSGKGIIGSERIEGGRLLAIVKLAINLAVVRAVG